MIPITKYNQQIFKETSRIIKLGHYIDSKDRYHDISEKIQFSISHSNLLPENISFEQTLSEKLSLRKGYGLAEKKLIFDKIEITQESTQAAARRYKELNVKEVCILNFANGFQPGGGVLDGCKAQEETLCRQSNLYFCLKNKPEMYEYNRRKKDYCFCSDYMIYTPGVVFFRDDEYELAYPLRIHVITSAAVDLRNVKITQDILQKTHDVMKNRIRKILQLGIESKATVIILGAFGCGAFLNNPEDISQIFKELLYDEFYGMYFDKIVFPIFGAKDKPNPNYDAFKATFNLIKIFNQ